MCTATVVPLEGGFRLAFNRDERRTRSTALPPVLRRRRHGLSLSPLDPDGGGTWIGANDRGLAAALLNRTIDRTAGGPGRRSRGLIVPAVLDALSLDGAVRIARHLSLADFKLFRLLLVGNGQTIVLTSNGRRLSVDQRDLTRPLMLTSSSLGDSVVQEPRQRLFAQLLGGDASTWTDGQAIFHAHRWPERPEVSVLMSRADARTVSHSLLTISSTSMRFQYAPLAEWCEQAA